MFMPFYPARLIENEKSAATIFLINQITFCIEFLKNCLMWMNLIILHKLQLLTIDLVINRFIILGLTQIPDVFISIQFCSKILEIVPHHWFTQVKSNESRSLPTFLGLVERILDNLKENSCNQSSSDILKITYYFISIFQ
uniref:PAX3-and PAX7-binding protein 1 (Trinotate prediction) n=1 Tax=Myxobolus squamalis TaxID=59785 RepID=A0A6B2G5T6_MYXSQ